MKNLNKYGTLLYELKTTNSELLSIAYLIKMKKDDEIIVQDMNEIYFGLGTVLETFSTQIRHIADQLDMIHPSG